MKDNPSIDPHGGNVSSQKKGLLKNPGKDFDGGFNAKAGTRRSEAPKKDGYSKWQGTVKGKIRHNPDL